MHRRLFGRFSAAIALCALAVPVSLMAASPSGAVTTCTSQMANNIAGSQSNLTMACISDYNAAGTQSTFIQIADTPNGVWRRGSARTVTGTAPSGSTTLTVLAATPVSADDVGRPINGPGMDGGTYIQAVAGATSATLSRKTAAAIPGGSTLTIEHTTARMLADANCGATTTLTSPNGKFTATDLFRSVGGGPYPAGSRIVVVTNATTVTVDANPTTAGNQAPPAPCTDANPAVAGIQDIITVGAAKYTAATGTATTYVDGYTRHVVLGAAPTGGAACAAGVLTFNASGGDVFASDKTLTVAFRKSTGVLADATVRRVASVNVALKKLTLTPASCPAPAAAATNVDIGQASDTAPSDLDVISQFVSELDLFPTLVPDSDDCARHTYEGFSLVGKWVNPSNKGSTTVVGGYRPVAFGPPPAVSVGQFLMPTGAGVDFAGYLQVVSGGLQVGSHFEVTFPLVPTAIALCPSWAGGKLASVYRFLAGPTAADATTPASGGGGSGNPTAPAMRALGPVTGLLPGVKIVLKNGATTVGTATAAGCTVIASTATPNFGCGDG